MKLSLKNSGIWIAGLSLVAAILLFVGLGNSTYSLDEVASIMISKDWRSLLYYLWREEGNMWLYYFLLHFWLKLGDSEFVVRSLSVAAGLASVPFVYLIGKEIKGRNVAIISSLLYVFNIYFYSYARDVRGYIFASLFISIGSYMFYKGLKRAPTSIETLIIGLCYLAAIYSHMLSGLILFAQLLALFFFPGKIPWKQIIICGLIIFIGLLPLLFAPSFRSHQVDWIQKPGPLLFIYGFIALGGDSIVATLIAGLVIIWNLLSHYKSLIGKTKAGFDLVWLSAWAVFPLTFGYIFSATIKPVYEPESFNSSLPAFVILLGVSLAYLWQKKKKMGYLIFSLISLMLFFRLVAYATESSKMHYVFENKSTRDWQKVVKYLDANIKNGDAVIYYAYYIKYPIEYYFHKYPSKYIFDEEEAASGKYNVGGGTRLPDPDIKKVDSLKKSYKRVWVILSYNEFDWLDRKKQWIEIEEELRHHFILRSDLKFDEIEVQLLENKKIK